MSVEGNNSRVRKIANAISVLFAIQALSMSAAPAETLRVGKAAEEFSFLPLDMGVRYGIFEKNGIEVESSVYNGGGQLQQALTADSIDIGLGSGPEMWSLARGVPAMAVAAMAGPQLVLGLMVRPDGTIHTVAELRGRRVGVTTAKSLSAWLVSELSRQQGWGPEGINITPLGAPPGLLAALMMMQVDGFVSDFSSLLRAEEAGEGKILVNFGSLVKDFHIHVIFATNKLIASRPGPIRAFLKGWFETMAFMRANKSKTIEATMETVDVDHGIAERTYDTLMPMFSGDGKFDAKALAALSRSFVELKFLPAEPDMNKLYTEEFLPKK
jgi:NitT/TauT family transport system substrate-binding protein